jgi:hypothetical protein
MRTPDSLLMQHYREKADHFFKAMDHLAGDMGFARTSVGLLAVHSAISLNDAIMAGTKGSRSKGEDHRTAAAELAKMCGELKVANLQGIEHFRWLLKKKTSIAYGNERISDSDLKLSVDKATRFLDWAYRQFKEVLRSEEA